MRTHKSGDYRNECKKLPDKRKQPGICLTDAEWICCGIVTPTCMRTYVVKYQLGNCTSRALPMFLVLAVHLWSPMVAAPFVPPIQEVQSTLVLRTATYGLQLNMGNELFSTKRWVSLSGQMSAFSTLWSNDLPVWFDSLDPMLSSYPLGVTVDELFHTDFRHRPACPRHVWFRWLILLSQGLWWISKSAHKGRSLGTSV